MSFSNDEIISDDFFRKENMNLSSSRDIHDMSNNRGVINDIQNNIHEGMYIDMRRGSHSGDHKTSYETSEVDISPSCD